MVIPEHLDSTELITRFLRNKDSEVEDVYDFVTEKLLHNTNPITAYLPQKERFVLELLIDRITQSNKLSQKFKDNFKTWELFNIIWNSCDNEDRLTNIRQTVVSKIKFGETFTKIYSDIYTQDRYHDEAFMNQITITTQRLLGNMKIYLSDDQNVSLVSNLLNFFVNNKTHSNELNSRIVEIATQIFELNNRGTLKYDSKHKSEFSRTCLANALTVTQDDNISDTLKIRMKSMIVKVLFTDPETVGSPSITTYIQQFTSVEYTVHPKNEDLLYLVEITITKVQVDKLEEVVKMLIKKFPESSSTLLKVVTDMNKTLSTEFLSGLVEKALENPTTESYLLISYAIKRSSDITFKFADQISKLCSKDNAESTALFKELFDSYMRNRETENFVKLWTRLVDEAPNTNFESDVIVDYISSKLVTLSYTQISELVMKEVAELNSNPNKNPIFLLAVSKCFMRGVSGSIQNALNKTLILNLDQLKPVLLSLLDIDGKLMWKLKYNILCLFDLEDIEEHLELLNAQKYVDDDYFYYSKLRIAEQNIDNLDKNLTKKFSSYFRRKSSAEFKYKTFSRFFMVLEYIYEKDETVALVGKLLDNTTVSELGSTKIASLLNNHLVQAQTNIISTIIDKLIANKKLFEYLKYVSVYAFNRSQKESAMNFCLTNLSKDYSLEIINQLIKMPTYRSKLETEFNPLLLLANQSNKEYTSIAKQILMMHFRQPVESEKYIQNVFNSLMDAFDNIKTKKCIKFEDHIHLTLLVLEVSKETPLKDLRNKLVEKSTGKAISMLQETSKGSAEIVKLLSHFLTEVNYMNEEPINFDGMKNLVSKLGQIYATDDNVKNSIFGLICSTGAKYNSEYIMALFIVLDGDDNVKSFERFMERLSTADESFSTSWTSFSQSIIPSDINDLKRFVTICGYFIKYAKKSGDAVNVKICRDLFVSTVSKIFSRIKESTSVTDSIVDFVSNLKLVTSTKTWLLTQYSMELIIAMITELSSILSNQKGGTLTDSYITLCQIISSIILYQRRRLSNRHHLIIAVLISLLKTLFIRSKEISSDGAAAFERLVSNFCEPSTNQMNVKSVGDDNVSKDAELNNALSQTKHGLRKNIPILIFNYIKFYLQYPVDLSIKQYVDNAVYMMLNLLTLNELNYINQSLDNQGILVLRTIHENYKQFYKWNEE